MPNHDNIQRQDSITSGDELSGNLSSQSSIDPSSWPFPEMDSESTVERLSVLIAEDNPVNARVLTRRLQKLGHEVELALDGQQCHDHFTTNPHTVDVILMDLQVSYLFSCFVVFLESGDLGLILWGRCRSLMVRVRRK